MTINEILQKGHGIPLASPAYPSSACHFVDREFLIITYRTDAETLRRLVPEPLAIDMANPLVKYEFIRMPDSSGFGDYTESGQVIPVSLEGRKGAYIHSMYLDAHAPTAAGREIWGFPKKMAKPSLSIDHDALLGELYYGKTLVASGSMGFKYQELDEAEMQTLLEAPNFLLKSIPHVDGSPRILELVEYHCEDVIVKGAWTGPAALQLFAHALAPVAELPVLEVVSAQHILADLTLGPGRVVHDYLA